MFTIKRFIATSLFALSLSSVNSYAADLTIYNATDYDSTSNVEHSSCSTRMGDGGITHKHNHNVVPGRLLRVTCGWHTEDCTADVYMTNNCSGPVVSRVTLSLTRGIINIAPQPLSDDSPFKGVTIRSDGFSVWIEDSKHENWFQRMLG